MTKILGLDPGTARTGFGVVERDGNAVRLIECGLIETSAETAQADRLQQIYEELRELITRHQPDQAAVEKLYFQTNAKTAIAVAEARGVIMLTVAQAHLTIGEYTPLQVKQSVTGYGQAGKAQVATMVCRQLGLKTAPRPDDVTDAVALALCHAWWRSV